MKLTNHQVQKITYHIINMLETVDDIRDQTEPPVGDQLVGKLCMVHVYLNRTEWIGPVRIERYAASDTFPYKVLDSLVECVRARLATPEEING